jgi:hypothetical protein
VLARSLVGLFLVVLTSLVIPPLVFCQENPYIVAYDHYMEEPGSLEVEYFSTFATQRGSNDFHSYWVELEYGAKAWWTTEFYLDAQSTFHDSTLFTGFRWENRSQTRALHQPGNLRGVRAHQWRGQDPEGGRGARRPSR